MKNRIEQALEKAQWDLDLLLEEISDLQVDIQNSNNAIKEIEVERKELLSNLESVVKATNSKRGEILALESLLEDE